jgi:hypothetical protein
MVLSRSSLVGGMLALLVLSAVAASPVQARIFVGVGVPLWVGPPIVVPPPVYYPPYYAPPPGYPSPGTEFSYTPPSAQPQALVPPGGYGAEGRCVAGAYVCPLARDIPPGGSCGCLGNDGRLVRGRAE